MRPAIANSDPSEPNVRKTSDTTKQKYVCLLLCRHASCVRLYFTYGSSEFSNSDTVRFIAAQFRP